MPGDYRCLFCYKPLRSGRFAFCNEECSAAGKKKESERRGEGPPKKVRKSKEQVDMTEEDDLQLL